MKLNEKQIDHLYTFTKQHYVIWYDLQTELVDHLANAIEYEWEQTPKSSFEEILAKEFKKFGIYGFMDVIEKKQRALQSKHNRFVWDHFKRFFTVPKIATTLVVMVLFFIFLKYGRHSKVIIVGLIVLFIGLAFYYLFKIEQARKRKLKSGEKLWLLEETIYRCSGLGSFLILPLNLLLQTHNHLPDDINDWILLAISFLFVTVGLVYYIVFCIIPSKAEEYLKQTYSEYKLNIL